MKSIICHFYNEEYLLPWWLRHHKKYFDYGLMINYNSSDNSVNIIKDICPDWQVVDSVNSQFNAEECDEEVVYYEKQIPGWKIALNATEFLYGNYSLLSDNNEKQEYYIPSFYFVDTEYDNYVDKSIPLHEQIFNGIDYEDEPFLRRLRCLHNSEINYPLGRHFENFSEISSEFVIFNYGFAPMNKHMVERKLQIQYRIPQSDKNRGLGNEHHNSGRGLDEKSLFAMFEKYKLQSKDLYDKMKKYLEKV